MNTDIQSELDKYIHDKGEGFIIYRIPNNIHIEFDFEKIRAEFSESKLHIYANKPYQDLEIVFSK